MQKKKQLTDTDVYTYIGGRYLTYDPHSRSLIETLRGTSKASLAVPFIVAGIKLATKRKETKCLGFNDPLFTNMQCDTHQDIRKETHWLITHLVKGGKSALYYIISFRLNNIFGQQACQFLQIVKYSD